MKIAKPNCCPHCDNARNCADDLRDLRADHAAATGTLRAQMVEMVDFAVKMMAFAFAKPCMRSTEYRHAAPLPDRDGHERRASARGNW